MTRVNERNAGVESESSPIDGYSETFTFPSAAFNHRFSLLTWLDTIAVNEFHDYLRKKRVRKAAL